MLVLPIRDHVPGVRGKLIQLSARLTGECQASRTVRGGKISMASGLLLLTSSHLSEQPTPGHRANQLAWHTTLFTNQLSLIPTAKHAQRHSYCNQSMSTIIIIELS